MASLINPSRPPPSSHIPPHRTPRKKASLLSLKRDKHKVVEAPVAHPFPEEFTRPPAHTRSSSPPRQNISSPRRLIQPSASSASLRANATQARHKETSAATSSSPHIRRVGVEREEQDSDQLKQEVEQTFSFPSIDYKGEGSWDPESTLKPHARPRSRTNTAELEEDWRDFRYDPSFRISGSSSQTQVEETPPQTPLEVKSFRHAFSIPVVVAAPVAGVETMDALVDGMNGVGSDDHFMGVSGLHGRSKSRKNRHHHPLYHPPLPTPPPGIVLGRSPNSKEISHQRDSDDGDEDMPRHPPPVRPSRRKPRRSSQSRSASDTTIMVPSSSPSSSLHGHALESRTHRVAFPEQRSKTIVPSITEIIRTHAPPEQQARSRRVSSRMSSYTRSSFSHGHNTVEEDQPSEPEPLSAAEESEFVTRSSIDSIADEVRQTLRNQSSSPVTTPRHIQHARSFPNNRQSMISDGGFSTRSPMSEGTRPGSFYSTSAFSNPRVPSPIESIDLDVELSAALRPTRSQAIAQYLNSSRLTTLLRLTHPPHASSEHPLTVSFSDLGSPTGFPLVVFLGLGCVRHIMGLYDEMAECLGIRLITIDRWGLGRTGTPKSKAARGIPEWGSVVEEVLDRLHINQCSVMAHSAGAPYALSFANRAPERIRGDICLLAPWVGGGEVAGYRWLKYVPNGILKTAQAAEWKVQGWMLGKPPKAHYEGIGFNAHSPIASPSGGAQSTQPSKRPEMNRKRSSVYPSAEDKRRPSAGSSSFSEYDDLADFDGRFESRSTLGARQGPPPNRASADGQAAKRKVSKGFLGRLKGESSPAQPQTPREKRSTSGSGRRLKALRSMGSLKGKSHSTPSPMGKSSLPESPILPKSLNLETGLGFDEFDWAKASTQKCGIDGPPSPLTPMNRFDINPRANGRRSISFTGPRSSPPSMISSPAASSYGAPLVDSTEMSYQVALGNALIAASHAESSKGTHTDLLQILNHDHQPWGFSYSAYPHNVRVWYGEKDERIAENAVRWMERAMGEDKCQVTVVKGADHGLMFKSAVVVELFERVREYWDND
ncbi:hypothetical protein JAAARDRAFT_148562 [Jaapia argillacea MUCL 33604]|uniref:AB hydrolase-1 domain-containing protein n=1 Tax=Jaapia argillacea MUCL 33604 TaxID=933084 RepID=A0A067QMH7_9AGAM|nr:hypothetical protein JAAARDRAFT_148562 [Jaapia argillacea MUCL 33604]